MHHIHRLSIPWPITLLRILRVITTRSPILYPITENQRRVTRKRDPFLALILPVIIYENDVEGMEVAWDIPEKSKQDVDEEIGATACYEEDSEGRDEDRDYDQANQTEETHVCCCCLELKAEISRGLWFVA